MCCINLHCSWTGFLEMGAVRCESHYYPPYHLYPQCTCNAVRLHCDTDCIQRHYINIYSVKKSREWDHCVLCRPSAYSNYNRIFNDPIGWWVAVRVSSYCLRVHYTIDPPGPPSTIRHSIPSNSANEVRYGNLLLRLVVEMTSPTQWPSHLRPSSLLLSSHPPLSLWLFNTMWTTLSVLWLPTVLGMVQLLSTALVLVSWQHH